MAKILDNMTSKRRLIKLSTDDIISVVREYQQIVHNIKEYDEIYSLLSDRAIFLPEDI